MAVGTRGQQVLEVGGVAHRDDDDAVVRLSGEQFAVRVDGVGDGGVHGRVVGEVLRQVLRVASRDAHGGRILRGGDGDVAASVVRVDRVDGGGAVGEAARGEGGEDFDFAVVRERVEHAQGAGVVAIAHEIRVPDELDGG